MKTFLNLLLSTVLLFFVSSCSSLIDTDPEVIESEIEKIQCNTVDVCCFDLSDQSGDYNLKSKWEFVGYQEEKGTPFDNLSCLARIAEFALGGEDYDKITRVTLILSEKTSPLINCENYPLFYFKSFNKEINGCYDSNQSGEILFNFGSENVILTPSNNYTTLPMVDFEQKIENDLSNVEKYEIDHNKLYLYIKGENKKMVFIAFMDKKTTTSH